MEWVFPSLMLIFGISVGLGFDYLNRWWLVAIPGLMVFDILYLVVALVVDLAKQQGCL